MLLSSWVLGSIGMKDLLDRCASVTTGGDERRDFRKA